MSDITTQTSDRNIVIIDFESPIDMANAGKFFVESMSKNFSLDSNNGREITGHNVQYFFDLKLTRKGSFTAGHLLMHYPQT